MNPNPHRRRILAALAAILFALLLRPPAGAAEGEWSRFRGPNGTGVSDAVTVPASWTDKDYNWKVDLPGSGHSSPVVWERRVFVTCADPETARRTILCLDAADGKTLWKRDEPSRKYGRHPDAGYSTSSPAADADGVVLTWADPERLVLLALDLEGHEKWRRDLGPWVTAQGSGISPIFVGDLVVLDDSQEDQRLIPGPPDRPPPAVGKSSWIALDRKTGEVRWRVERPTTYASYGTPCVRTAAGGRTEIIFTSSERGISGVDPATGKLLWELGEKFLDRTISSPVLAPDLILAGHGAGLRGTRFLAVHPGGEGRKPSVAWETRNGLPLVPTPIVKDGRIYLWCDDGVVSCLRVDDGQLVWRDRVEGAFYGSPVWVDRRLYAISKAGEVVVIAAGDKFEPISRAALGEPSFATPAVAGGVLYLRTRSRLFSLGGKTAR